LDMNWTAVHQFGSWIGLRGSDVAAVVGEFADATRFAAFDRQTRQQRPREPGLGIFGKTHLALPLPLDALRFRHVSIRVAPRDFASWIEKGIEMRGTDEFGNAYFTIGAGSNNTDTNFRCDGTLISDLNRTADVLTPPEDPLEALPYPPALEEVLLQALLDANASYPDDLPYACRPEQNPGFYNSNSFAHGLLNAVGLPLPRFPERWPSLAPGWQTPVPLSKFR